MRGVLAQEGSSSCTRATCRETAREGHDGDAYLSAAKKIDALAS